MDSVQMQSAESLNLYLLPLSSEASNDDAQSISSLDEPCTYNQHDELIETLDPWLQWLRYSGLHHGLRGPQSMWANLHAAFIAIVLYFTASETLYVFFFVDDPSSISGLKAPLGKIAFLLVACFDAALGTVFLACAFFYRSEERLKATFVILFQDNPLMRQPRLEFAIKLRKRYMPLVKVFCAIWTLCCGLMIIYYILIGGADNLTFQSVLYDLVVGFHVSYISFVMSTVMVIPFFHTIVHRFAIEHMQSIISDPVTFAKCKPDMQDQIVKQTTDNAVAFESGGASDLMAVESGYVSSSDGKFACVDELHYMLIMIRRHRQMLAEACAAQMWLFTSLCASLSFFAVSYMSASMYCIVNWPVPNLTMAPLIEFCFFSIILAALLLIFFYCVASVTQAYQQCTRAVMSRGCGALMRTAKQHAWQMQLLASTPEADFFQVMGLSVNFELVSRVSYAFILFISYMMSSGKK